MWVNCEHCGRRFHSDDDPECFWETGTKWGVITTVYCELCRDELEAEKMDIAQDDAADRQEYEQK